MINEIKKINPPEDLLSKHVTHQTAIESSKFDTTPRSVQLKKDTKEHLPVRYGDNNVVLQVRDPWWLYCYWEVKERTIERLKLDLKEEYNNSAWALRIYDVSSIIFDGTNANKFFDIHFDPIATNRYINVASNCSYVVDLGLKLRDGRFIAILRSNSVTTPLVESSYATDEEGLLPDHKSTRHYNVGLHGSSPLGRKGREREYISSPGFISSFGAKNKSP